MCGFHTGRRPRNRSFAKLFVHNGLPMRLLTAIPVHNEEASLVGVLTEVLKHAGDVLVVDDGSTDGRRRC